MIKIEVYLPLVEVGQIEVGSHSPLPFRLCNRILSYSFHEIKSTFLLIECATKRKKVKQLFLLTFSIKKVNMTNLTLTAALLHYHRHFIFETT
jgi:hypothetical protein